MLSHELLFRVEEVFFNFVLKEICMIHVLYKLPRELAGRTDLHLHKVHISCLSQEHVDVSDMKYIVFSLLKRDKMSLIGHHFMAEKVHIPKDTYLASAPIYLVSY